ncbi:MAG: rRNA maturation RNase YbeY [Clostridia bacterium]|nr:rRNA maturation RNase YbeY [Clostridia bacterium]
MLNVYCEEFDFNNLSSAFEGETESDCDLSAEIIICGEDEIQRLNRETRGIDAVTDVLSFPSLDGIRGKKLLKEDFPADFDEEGNLFLGSIAICEKRSKEQAEEYGHSFNRELHYLATHGLFHLLGYDHMTDEDKLEMRAREEKVLTKIGITREG